MAWTPLRLRFRSGAVIFDGEAEGAGGGAQPVQCAYSSVNTSIDNAQVGALPFGNPNPSGDDLLDRTTPDAPTFLTSGFYALTGNITVGALTAGGSIAAEVDETTYGILASVPSAPDLVTVPYCAVFQATAGDTLQVYAYNNDGASARAFSLLAVLVKLG